MVDDHAVFVAEVAGSDMAVDPDSVADAQLGEGRCGAHGVQELAPGVDRVCERREVFVELAVRDRVEQQALGILGAAARRGRAKAPAGVLCRGPSA